MDRRLLISLLVALAAQVPLTMVVAPAYADDDGSDGGDDGEDGSGEDGSDDDGSDDDGSDDDGSDDDGSDDGGGGDDLSGHDGDNEKDDHDDALHAVEAEDALTLKQILAAFSRQASGTVIDVTLERRHEALVYCVKYIDPAGRVRRIEFDALSGALLR